MKCARCDDKECYTGKDCTYDIEVEYDEEDLVMMKNAALIEAEHYMKKTRLEEMILFSKKMGYKKLGVAFCIGLEREAEILCRILEKDFVVESACCKICGTEKDELELEKIRPEQKEISCNPLAQAVMMNRANTQMNIIVGLCLGHDMTFTKYSNAPVTTFIVKDRILAHNTAGAIYSKYYLKNLL